MSTVDAPTTSTVNTTLEATSTTPNEENHEKVVVAETEVVGTTTTNTATTNTTTDATTTTTTSTMKHNNKMLLSRMIQDTKSTTKHMAQKTTSTIHHIADRVVTTTTKVVNCKVSHNSNNDDDNNNDSNSPIVIDEKSANDVDNNGTSFLENSVINSKGDTKEDQNDELSPLVPKTTKGSSTDVVVVKNDNTTTTATVITLHPIMEFMIADMTLVFLFTFITASYTTYDYYYYYLHQIPTSTTTTTNSNSIMKLFISWMIASFMFGLSIGQYFPSTDSVLQYLLPTNNNNDEVNKTSNRYVVQAESSSENDTGEDVDVDETVINVNTGNNHSLFTTLLGPSRSSRIQFRTSLNTNNKNIKTKANWMIGNKRTKKQLASIVPKKVKVWTTLNTIPNAEKQQQNRFTIPKWQKNINPTNDGFLIQNLLKHDSVRRIVRRKTLISSNDSDQTDDDHMDQVTINETTETIVTPSEQQQQHNMGSMELSAADTLDDYVIEPLFHLRGMDIYLTDDVPPEVESSTHPYLIDSGLRSVPTFVVNVLTQWGNILIYFEMPTWVDSFNLTEEESDPDDVKALKRFLNGDANYRNERLKMIPSLVDGPMPIRVMAPPKREKVVHCDWMPITWNQHEKEVDSNGNTLHPILEAVLDCMTSRAIRSMAGLVKKYLHMLSVDVAIVIGTPDKQSEVEPSACLGMWRFHHIEISNSPQLPDRYLDETKSPIVNGDESITIDRIVSADVQRASIVIGAISST